MHGPVAAGKVTAITFNDAGKQIEICAKVVDDAEWAKVVEGVYTGFSQGGAYERRWTDAEGFTRYTAAPNEISLVDLPCLPQATFEMIKADGTSERRRFGKGMDNVARLANLIEELDWLQNSSASEEMTEQGDSGVPGELRDLVARASAILRTMVSEETAELARDGASLAPMTMFAAPLKAASFKTPRLCKVGARNNEKDQARIQHLHDTSVELGAVCETQKVMRGGLEKHFDVLVEAIADVLRRVKKSRSSPCLCRSWATRERSQKARMRAAMLMMAAASRSCLRTPKLCRFSPSNWRSAMAVRRCDERLSRAPRLNAETANF